MSSVWAVCVNVLAQRIRNRDLSPGLCCVSVNGKYRNKPFIKKKFLLINVDFHL